tara:strand:- start:33662 stop:34876 length:1215 start_codon:yes stop_codon:yes gene_type:complete
MIISNELNENKKEFFISLLLISIPITFIIGSSVINVTIVLIDLYFLYILFKNKDLKFLNNRYFFSLIVLWIYLIINLFFSINFIESLPRSIGFIRFILFAFAINYFFLKKSRTVQIEILNAWTFIFLFVSIDLIFEFIFGFNFFGFVSPFEGRLGGVFGEELKIGHFYSAFVLVILFNLQNFLRNKSYNDYFFYTLVVSFLLISLIIGERSNFLKTFLIVFFFILIFDNRNFFKKIVSVFLLLIALSTLIYTNKDYKVRFWGAGIKALSNPIESVLNSKYGSHYKVAIQVFQNNKLFGVGLKNYRLEVIKNKYVGDPSIHPHQTHFEIISELGLIGYIFFISVFFFILLQSLKSYLSEKDNLKLCGILFIIISLAPLLPSGSFFTTYGAALFWFNFSFILPKNT